MAIIKSQVDHCSGIPLGGIGTGSIEIRPDGHFHEWQIFNLGIWAPSWNFQPECCKKEPPEMRPDSMCFYAWAKPKGEAPVMRRLGTRSDQHNLYSFAWLKSVREIEFNGTFPVAKLSYLDSDLPVEISSTMFSPFFPHDARTSGTPGFNAIFTVRNRSNKPVEFSLLSTLRNPLAPEEKDRKLHNSITRDGDSTFLTMQTEAESSCKATLGSLGLSVTGGKASWISGEYNGFLHGYTSPDGNYGWSHESLFHDFRASGRLPSLAGNRSPSQMLRQSDKELEALSKQQINDLVCAMMKYPFVHSLWQRIMEAAPALLKTTAGLIQFLKSVRARINALCGDDRARQSWGQAALASTVSLAPGETREIRFTLGWHFPWHFSKSGKVIGHMYDNWFKDAGQVNRFLAKHCEEHRTKTFSFAAALQNTSLDTEMADAWAGQLTTIPKCTWWLKNGDFGVWEGLGCCGFHTTDITYQGSFNLVALFPQLQKRQMEMGARFQRKDGRVHHFFTPDLSNVDDGFDRVDMNQQFVLLACRDYLWTGDKAYIKRLWPNILRAMKNTAELDADGDGLPDHDTRRNTYDSWDFAGTPSYIASLWLSALLAAERIAVDLGHKTEAAAWNKILKKAAASFDRKLWNGEYYSLWVDGKIRDECCMTDQLDGEWFTQLIGLGHVLPRERILAGLKAVMKYCFTEENGLQNANYPDKAAKRMATHRNTQQTAPWSGIEYSIASMMMDFGMMGEGRRVVKNIHERHWRAGRFWNHGECGDHYYRAMSSWAILLAATGFKLDLPRGIVTFAPPAVLPEFHAPWFSSRGWGQFTMTGTRFHLSCNSGTIAFRELRLGCQSIGGLVLLNDRPIKATRSQENATTVLRFAKPLTIKAGDKLVVE